MPRSPLSRETLLPRLAAFVLAQGIGAASLRPLARAAGTSDRMLIYHFGSKEQLLVDVLALLAQDYSRMLDGVFDQAPPASRRAMLERIYQLSDSPAAAPYVALWWDMVAGAAREFPGFREAAQTVVALLLGWLEAHMPADDPDPVAGARHLLTVVEGAQVLRAVGRGDIAAAGIAACPPSP